MNFASDNWAGASPRIRDAFLRACEGSAPAYGGDDLTKALEARFAELFEHEVTAFVVPTGTAANSLALAALTPPYGAVLAHEGAHVVEDECGAPEFFTGGAKMVGIPGVDGKLTPETVEAMAERFPDSSRFPLVSALSLTQATECGTLYSVDEVSALAEVAHARKIAVHMDGARFGNAVAALGVSPASITWKAGVDVLSFGGTKNGAMMAEAVVFFDSARAESLARRRQRAGHTLSKARLISTQFLALLEDGHWLDLAGHANAMAKRLSDGLAARGFGLAWPTQANEVFPILPKALVEKLQAAGAKLYDWPDTSVPADRKPKPDETVARLVCSFATEAAEVERFLGLVG